jgi:hypothetical protein
MSRETRVVRRSIAAAILVFAACDQKPTAPTPAPAVTALTVSCDATTLAAVGQRATCQARVTFSDAATKDATPTAQWSSSDPTKVAVSSTGQLTAVAIGSADITATASGLTGRQTVSVTVACEFAVSPAALSFASGGGSQTVTLTASPPDCSPSEWTAVSDANGLTVSPASGRGSGSISLTAAANTGAGRTMTATIAGRRVTVAIAEVPPPPPKRTFTLSLTLLPGEQLSGPYTGTVTGPNGFRCANRNGTPDDVVVCPAATFEEGTIVQLTATLNGPLGLPIRTATGCDQHTSRTCTVVMNADRQVSITIGCELFCGSEPIEAAWTVERDGVAPWMPSERGRAGHQEPLSTAPRRGRDRIAASSSNS